MAQETFGQLWNKVLLYAPNTPVPLAQQFVKNSYKRVLGAHEWSENYKEAEVVIADTYATGTVTVTNGSTTVALTGTVTTDWENVHQIGIENSTGYAPWYDVVSVNTTNDEITLDRAYEGASSTNAEFLIAQVYLEVPDTDFEVLDDIRDATSNWRLRRQFHQPNYLDLIDAKRGYSGTPLLYVPVKPRVASGLSYTRYEFWPRIPESTHLIYRYVAQADFSGTSTQRPIVGIKPEVIIWGALSELALWPGTAERPNPFFSLDIHKQYDKLFEDGLHDSIMGDINKAQRMLFYAEDDRGYPADARFIQEHGLA